MQKSPFHLSQLVPFLPYLYFILLPVSSFLSQMSRQPGPDNFLLLIPALPFVIQLFFSLKHVDIVMGVITFAIALYLTFAYWWDVAKITDYTAKEISFIFLGGLITILNYVMSVRLFKNEFMRIERAKVLGKAY